MACYYIVISSTHLRDGQLRSIKGVFRGPIGTNRQKNTEDSKFYCELCDKQYVRQQQYENHINSYDHHHKQRLKELKQREFYRALACRRQRRRKEEKKEERALRRVHQHDERRTGECAPGSGPMFRSTTVAVDPANQSRPDFERKWAAIHPNGASLGTTSEAALMEPFLPLETRLLSNARWPYRDAQESRILGKTHLDNRTKNSDGTGIHFHKSAWTRDYVCDRAGAAASDPPLHVAGRVRPVSFVLPKRSCVLLHQSAAVFIQAGAELPRKPDAASVQERSKTFGEKVAEQRMDAANGNQRSMKQKSAIQQSECAEKGPAGLSGTEAQTSPNATGAENSITNWREAELSASDDRNEAAAHRSLSGVSEGASKNVEPANIETEVRDAPDDQKEFSAPHEDPTSEKPPASASLKRPKEPFCPVLSRDGGTVLLWPTEMLSYTKTSPSVSFSINPLLYDFRAHGKAKEASAEERIKPSVIKREEAEGGGEVRTDEREEDGGGRAGNPADTSERSGDESSSKSTESHRAAKPSLRLAGGRRRRRRGAGGGSRGARKRGKRKRRAERRSRTTRTLCLTQMFEGEEKLKGAKELLGKGKRMKGEEGRMREDQAGGELLSNLPVDGCNGCEEPSRHQSHSGAAFSWVISPETPREGGKAMGEEQKNPPKAEIRAARDAEENVCNLPISGVPASCREQQISPKAQTDAARRPQISSLPGCFRETACDQRQSIPAAHGLLRAGKRKGASMEAESPRKRRRGKRRTRKASRVLTSDPAESRSDESCPDTCGVPAADWTRTKQPAVYIEGETFSCDTADDSEGRSGPETVDGVCRPGNTQTEEKPNSSQDKTHNSNNDVTPTTFDLNADTNTNDRNPFKLDETFACCGNSENFSVRAEESEEERNLGTDPGSCGGDTADALNCTPDCHRRGDAGEPDPPAKDGASSEKQPEWKSIKKMREEWEKEWARRKEGESAKEKRRCFPPRLPPQCLPLPASLLLQPTLSSSTSSSFSLHRTIIQRNLSLLPPSPLPVPAYFLPSFPPLVPPPPPPPAFFASRFSFLDAPGSFPLAFHPVQTPRPALFSAPHPAVVPLQVLF